jgi:flagellar biosynthesis/type III secretory pathway M-ring protein FliF/YscJ
MIIMNETNELEKIIQDKMSNINTSIKHAINNVKITRPDAINLKNIKFCGEDISKAEQGIYKAKHRCLSYNMRRWLRMHNKSINIKHPPH